MEEERRRRHRMSKVRKGGGWEGRGEGRKEKEGKERSEIGEERKEKE